MIRLRKWAGAKSGHAASIAVKTAPQKPVSEKTLLGLRITWH